MRGKGRVGQKLPEDFPGQDQEDRVLHGHGPQPGQGPLLPEQGLEAQTVARAQEVHDLPGVGELHGPGAQHQDLVPVPGLQGLALEQVAHHGRSRGLPQRLPGEARERLNACEELLGRRDHSAPTAR